MENNTMENEVINTEMADAVVMNNPVLKEHASTLKIAGVSAGVFVAGTVIKWAAKKLFKKLVKKAKTVAYVEEDGTEVEVELVGDDEE